MGTCPNCSSPVPWRDRLLARFGRIQCPNCGVPLRANVTTAIVVLYTALTVLIFFGFTWGAVAGCAWPLIVLFVVWIAGELMAGIVSPLRREE